jgi:hypothetical protein
MPIRLNRLAITDPMNRSFLLTYFSCCAIWVFAFVPSVAMSQTEQHQKQIQQRSFSHEWGNIISLDGMWDIAEGNKQQVPSQFLSKVPVPGLVTSAKPAFKAVGEENNLREAYWYRKKFKVSGSIPALGAFKDF